MYQIDNSTAAVSQPAATAAGSAGYFTDGNPATSTPATIVPAEWLNAVMMELVNVVTGAGLTLSKPTYNQVLAAIKRLGQNTIVLADTGAANAYTAANASPLVAGTWVDGVIQAVKIAHANTGASTYAPDGLTAIPIYGLGLQPLQGGELALNGTAVMMRTTIAGVNSGNPIAVLMECAGGAQQVAPATQSSHAVQLGQFLATLSANGYVKIPVMVAGVLRTLILQWGATGNYLVNTASTTSDTITFPISFPTACLQVLATADGSTTPNSAIVLARNWAQSSFTMYFQNTRTDQSVSGHWLAVGY